MVLTVGGKAPDFTLPSTDNADVTLSQFKGRPVLVYFYPKDDTPGCTKQACGFRDNMERLKAIGAAILGISKDSLKSHATFRDKFNLNFPLLADEDGKVVKSYGVWVEKSMYGKKYMGIERSSFLIDATGTIARIWHNVTVDGHQEEVIAAVEDLTAGS